MMMVEGYRYLMDVTESRHLRVYPWEFWVGIINASIRTKVDLSDRTASIRLSTVVEPYGSPWAEKGGFTDSRIRDS